MKKLILLIFLLLCANVGIAQNAFKPVVAGGLQDVETGKSFRLVKMEGKDSLQIYNALLTMVKESFSGVDDEILQTDNGSYIKAKGYNKRAMCLYYDISLEVEFRIKDGRYIYEYSKFNVFNKESSDGKTKELVIGYGGSNLLREDKSKNYLLRKNGKPTLTNGRCYKDLIKALDALDKIFDISDDFDKYKTMKEEKDSGWK